MRDGKTSKVPIIICRTGWMTKYDGDFGTWRGRHRFVTEGRGLPHEAFNFHESSDGFVYGFVQIKEPNVLNLNRLGAPSSAPALDGVTVVWCSQFKGKHGLRIHGWYKNSIAYRNGIVRPQDITFDQEIRARFRAPASDVTLLDENEREFVIPPKTLGMADVYFADENAPRLAREIRSYILDHGSKATPNEKLASRFNTGKDGDGRKRVEVAAINAAEAFFEQRGYKIRDRQKEKCGWDLEAQKGKSVLRIEVKGRGSDQPFIALTPNEFRAFKAAEADPTLAKTYRLFTVQNATKANSELGLFRFKGAGWHCELTRRSLRADVLELAFVNLVES